MDLPAADRPAEVREGDHPASLVAGGILLGMGLGGFVDGVVVHQILQWHHMGTATPEHAEFPASTAASLEQNTLWDGLFHAGTWVLAFVGLLLIWHASRRGHGSTWRTLVGLLLTDQGRVRASARPVTEGEGAVR